MGENPSILPIGKTLHSKFTFTGIKSVILSLSNSNFHLITLYRLHLQLQSLLLYHFFLTSGFMYIHVMLVLINQCLMNVVFSMAKALNGQSSPKRNFYFPTFQRYLETLFLLMLVFLFFTVPFSFELTPLQLFKMTKFMWLIFNFNCPCVQTFPCLIDCMYYTHMKSEGPSTA